MIESSCVERFLRYVTFGTQSDPASATYPSTPGQLELLRQVADELRAVGLDDVEMDEFGYVTATIPATSPRANVPVIGFIAHVDTSPEMRGDGVRPLVHRNYQGGDLVLPDDPSAVIRAADNPLLQRQLGNDLITASGTTLLGADNKAGVAEIVAAAEFLMRHPEIPHGKVRVAFTPDEEIGQGTRYFDLEKFGARYAYTVDSESAGQVDGETFAANKMAVAFQGFNTHPGYAKGKMVNAIKVAASFLASLPRDGLAPETTEGHEGFVHPMAVDATVDRTVVSFIVRDFQVEGLEEKQALLRELAAVAVAQWPGASVEFEVTEQYRNMKEVLDAHPEVMDCAREAMRRAELEVIEHAIRGGTDGAQLSFRGLPTPNIFAGEHNYHSRYEWVSAQDMHKAVEVIVHLCQVWEERG